MGEVEVYDRPFLAARCHVLVCQDLQEFVREAEKRG